MKVFLRVDYVFCYAFNQIREGREQEPPSDWLEFLEQCKAAPIFGNPLLPWPD